MSEFRFEGGLLDGFTVGHPEINDIADLMPTGQGRSLLLVPPPDQCGQILRKELTKADAPGPLHLYELFSRSEEVAVFRYTPKGFANALAEQSAPLTQEEQQRQREFEELADEFAQRVREFEFTPDTVVELLTYYTDEDDNPIPGSRRTELATQVTLRGFPNDDATREMALRWFVSNVVDNINSLVRGATTRPFPVKDGTGRMARISTFELEIRPM